MNTKIDYIQLENILQELTIHNIPSKAVLNLLDIENLAELTVKQYNYLLLMIKN